LKLLIIVAAAFQILLVGCSEAPKDASFNDSAITAQSKQRDKNRYLAYEHHVTVDAPEERLEELFNNVIEHCANDIDNACTVLDSNLDTGRYVSANIRLRIKPDGVKETITIAAKDGDIVNQSTHVEDLAKPIAEKDKRLKMLQSYRAKLIELEKKAGNDIDALIKIASELSNVQSELEQAKGGSEHLLLQTNMDIINIGFTANKNRGFWSPVSRSLSSFSRNLSEAISQTITVTAYILPWLIIIIGIWFLFRYLWRRGIKA